MWQGAFAYPAKPKALDARLMEMRSQLRTLCKGMDGLSRALLQFAAALEVADEKVADMMK